MCLVLYSPQFKIFRLKFLKCSFFYLGLSYYSIKIRLAKLVSEGSPCPMNHSNKVQSYNIKGELQLETKLISYERAFKMLENNVYIVGIARKCFDIWDMFKMAPIKSVEPGNNSFSINHIIRCRSKLLPSGLSKFVLILIV